MSKPSWSGPREWRGAAYSSLSRWITNLLLLFGAVNVPWLLLLLVTQNDPPLTPPLLLRWFAYAIVLPAILAWLLHRSRAAELFVRDDDLVIKQLRLGLRLEVPCESIAAIETWRLPLPGPGFVVRLRSGRRLHDALQTADIVALLDALQEVGVASAAAALSHPTVLFAAARRRVARKLWYHWVGKFALFGLIPTAALFNAHQHIAYGGLLGEYYLLGLQAYLRTFGEYWATVTVYLALYAGLWRGAAEVLALAAAWIAPPAAPLVRRAVEIGVRLAYYVGVPLLLVLRFVG